MKRLSPLRVALLSVFITPLHGSVTLDLGGNQTAGTGTTTVRAGTLQLGTSSFDSNAVSSLRIDGGNLSNGTLLLAESAGPYLYPSLTNASQLLLPLNTGGVVNSIISGGNLSLGNSTGSLQILGNNTYNPGVLRIDGGTFGLPRIISGPGLLLQEHVGPRIYPSLTNASQLLLPLNTGVSINNFVSGGTLILGNPPISLGSASLTALSSSIRLITSSIRLITSGGALVLNNEFGFPLIYGPTIVNEPSPTTINGGTLIASGSLVKTGTGTLTLNSGNTLNVIPGGSLTTTTGLILGSNPTSTSSFPLLYGATIVNEPSPTTINSGTLVTSGSLVNNGTGTLTINPGYTLNVNSGGGVGSGLVVGPNTTLNLNGSPESVPEPGSVLLLASGLGTLFLRRRRTPRG